MSSASVQIDVPGTSTDEFIHFSNERGILLQDQFLMKDGKHSRTVVDVSISRDKLFYAYGNPNGCKSNSAIAGCLALSDVVGCLTHGPGCSGGQCPDNNAAAARGTSYSSWLWGTAPVKPYLDENGACLHIFAYRYDKEPKHGGERRRIELCLRAENYGTSEENVATVERWRLVLLSILRGVDFCTIDDLTEALLPPPPHYLVCINPFGGSGRALQIFRQQVQPIFVEAGITFKTVVTERRGHGFEIAKKLDLKEFSGIIIVSGDGLMYEFINGFRERGDREEAFRIPFGIIPGGSGNGLCAAILTEKREQVFTNMALHAAFRIVKGRPHPKDLAHMETKGSHFFSFLCLAWGLVADVDIESERFRFLGNRTRIALGTVNRLLFLRTIRGRVSYLPVADASQYDHLLRKREGGWRKGTVPPVERSARRGGDERNSTVGSSNGGTGKGETPIPDDDGDIELPPLSEPVPPDWTVIEQEFCTMIVAYVSHISRDFVTHPGRAPDEGVLTLQYMDASITRAQLAWMMNNFMTGEYLRDDSCNIRFVRAFRLEPLGESGILTVDGERVEYGPIQGKLTPLKCNCIM